MKSLVLLSVCSLAAVGLRVRVILATPDGGAPEAIGLSSECVLLLLAGGTSLAAISFAREVVRRDRGTSATLAARELLERTAIATEKVHAR